LFADIRWSDDDIHGRVVNLPMSNRSDGALMLRLASIRAHLLVQRMPDGEQLKPDKEAKHRQSGNAAQNEMRPRRLD
jgi:hypothetical protein